ncbi:MAG TPA: LysR family transcriptional regulator [Polyangiaceae bacterium]|nr:LysR family transcriptional regulator [Polyangiaceae bacterium]
MEPRRAGNLDLNLLVTLDAVLAERSTRRAAARLKVTQPAVSHALRRLRETLGDPLLIPTAGGMVPTPRAERLAGTLRRCLAELEGALDEGDAFDPATARRSFVLSAPDATGALLLPSLMRQLARAAPGVDVVVRPPQAGLFERLASGEIDLALGVFDASPAPFRRKTLYRQRYACLVRAGHPRAPATFGLDDYLALDHVSVAPQGAAGSPVDDALAKLGRRRRVALVVPHFLVAPLVVAETDLALLAPEGIGRRFGDLLGLRLVEPPLELGGFPVSQLWHERTQADPAHTWLRETLVALSKSL